MKFIIGDFMEFYIVNGSPRKKYNTAQLLEKASEGIENELRKQAENSIELKERLDGEGINIHHIHLYDLDFKGCKSCFHCKRIGGKYYSQCPIKDDLRELIPEMQNAVSCQILLKCQCLHKVIIPRFSCSVHRGIFFRCYSLLSTIIY